MKKLYYKLNTVVQFLLDKSEGKIQFSIEISLGYVYLRYERKYGFDNIISEFEP